MGIVEPLEKPTKGDEEEVDIDTLAERLHADTGPVGRIAFWPTVIGAYATKPSRAT